MFRFFHIVCPPTLAVLLVSQTSLAQGSARFLYLENCGEAAISQISVEIRKSEKSDWVKSGRRWLQSPLLSNQAACFDTADMYGDVPDEGLTRLKVELEGWDPITCPPTRVDKASTGDLRAFTFFSMPLEAAHFYLGEGCHSRGFFHWQPKQLCAGQGERVRDIQCD